MGRTAEADGAFKQFQQKQAKKHKAMIESLDRGDKIVTVGGLIAEVVKPEEEYFKVKLNDDTVVKLSKEYVAKKIEDEVKS